MPGVPKVLAVQLRPRIGQKVLGRLGQGQAKPGQDAPWVLAEATESDVDVALAFLAKIAAPVAAAPPF